MKILFSPLGQWRSNLLWRLFGLACLQLVILQGQHYSLLELNHFPKGYHCLFLSASLLILLGPSLSTLIFNGVSLYLFLTPIFIHTVELQLSEEYIILLTLPTMSFFLTGVCFLQTQGKMTEQFQRQVDVGNVLLFRISVLLVMSFAAFHKINADFLNPDFSCGLGLTKTFDTFWSWPIPAFIVKMPPVLTIISEALVPIFLYVYYPLGILYTLLLIGFIGHVGATVFTLIVMVMAFGFLCNKDIDKLRIGIERYGWVLIGIQLLMAVFSYRIYVGPKPWYEFFIFQSVLLTLCFLSVVLFSQGIVKFRLPSLLPKNQGLKVVLIIFIIIGLVNGFAPYLGFKYRLSFAMLSNLRVDQTRWNHLWIPKGVFLPQSDPFVHVKKIKIDYQGIQTLESLRKKDKYYKGGIYPGLFSPMSLKYRLRFFKGTYLTLVLSYKGKDYIFEDIYNNQKFQEWLEQLPDSKMIQEWLAIEGGQPCFH